MKPFQFSLQKVHDLREIAEREALGDLGAALAHLDQVEARLVALEREQARIEGDLATHLAGGRIDSLLVKSLHGDLARYEAGRKEVKKERALAWRQVEAAQEQARTRRAERRATETLRESALERHELEMRQQEQRDLDEVAAIRHTRKGRTP